jgi:predicted Rossmann fold nucleotide-binding protein DprA/Smf involved in DNA uptake
MNLIHLYRGMPNYPDRLTAFLADRAPSAVTARGNLEILWDMGRAKTVSTLALLCSVKCPGGLLPQAYDLVCALRDSGVTVISGFHSPLEKECLSLLLRGTQPVIICPARSLEKMRIPAECQKALDTGRVLLLSAFEEKQRRATAEMAYMRNQFVAAIADEVFIVHAAFGSKTEQFCRDLLEWHKPLWTLDCPENIGLMNLGAKILRLEGVRGKDIAFFRSHHFTKDQSHPGQ